VKVIISGIETHPGKKMLKKFEENGIIVIFRGRYVDLEIRDEDLALKILKEKYGIVL